MGLSAIIIVLYHEHLRFGFPLYKYTIGEHGNIGVDFFLFVSGFGLAHSLSKHQAFGRYYGRRLSRVLPTFYAFSIFMGLLGVIFKLFGGDFNLSDFIFPRLVPIGIWFNMEFPKWYVSAVLGYYVFAAVVYPFLEKSRYLILSTALLTFVTAWYIPSISEMTNVTLMVTRFTALVVGLSVGLADVRKAEAPRELKRGLCGLGVLFFIGALMFLFRGKLSHTVFRTFDDEKYNRVRLCLMAPLLSVATAYGFSLCDRIRLGFVGRLFSHLGKYSLEMYLVHSAISELSTKLKLPGVVRILFLLVFSYLAARLLMLLANLLRAFASKYIAPLLFTRAD